MTFILKSQITPGADAVTVGQITKHNSNKSSIVENERKANEGGIGDSNE